MYARLSEPQLLHYYEPQPGLFLAESTCVIERALDVGYEPVSFLARKRGGACRKRSTLFALPGRAGLYSRDEGAGTAHRLCPHARHALRDAPPHASGYREEICRNARRVAILENVVNPTNVGAIFRSCRRAWHRCRASHIRLKQPAVPPRHPREHGKCLQVPWTVLPGGSYWPEQGIAALQELGFYTVAMALKEDSVPMDDPSLKTHEKARHSARNRG